MENLCVLCGAPSGDKLFCSECDAPDGVARLPEYNPDTESLRGHCCFCAKMELIGRKLMCRRTKSALGRGMSLNPILDGGCDLWEWNGGQAK